MGDHISADGRVVARHPAAFCTVELDDGRTVQARLAGRLQQRHMPRVVTGDRVAVRFSPHDADFAQVYWRHRP